MRNYRAPSSNVLFYLFFGLFVIPALLIIELVGIHISTEFAMIFVENFEFTTKFYLICALGTLITAQFVIEGFLAALDIYDYFERF